MVKTFYLFVLLCFFNIGLLIKYSVTNNFADTVMPQQPNYIDLFIPGLIESASKLPLKGQVLITPNKLIYLNIDDDFIHQLFPLVKSSHSEIQKPDYFGKGGAGAHISIIYPLENAQSLSKAELNQQHEFKIIKAVSALLGTKRYYVLLVKSDSLIALRNKHGLEDKLLFKNYWIDLHITIGTSLEIKTPDNLSR